jgi:hypothetical protein
LEQRSTKPGINIVKASTVCIMVSNSSLKHSYNLFHSYAPKRFKFTTCSQNSGKQIALVAGGMPRMLSVEMLQVSREMWKVLIGVTSDLKAITVCLLVL